jgi:DinB superfamily
MNEDAYAAALDLLDSTPRILQSICAPLPDWLLETPADADWSPKDVLAHLLVSQERGSFSRVRAILGSEQPVLQNYDEQEELERSGFRSWEPEVLRAELIRKRSADVEWVRTLGDEALARAGLHSEVGRVTAREFIYHAANHDCLHLRQLLGMLQAHVEPLRGAMRAF